MRKMSDESHENTTRPVLVRGGDQDALGDAFDDYRPRLRRTVQFRLSPRLLGRVDADDVLQEAYLAATQRCAHMRGDTEQALFIWLRMIVLQTLTDVHRRHLGAKMRDAGREAARPQLQGAQNTSVSLAANLIGRFTSPSLAARRAELSEQLRATLDGMDPIDREVLALRHFEELTNSEIAEALEIEQKAASIRYVRALRRLREILAEMPGFGESLAGGL